METKSKLEDVDFEMITVNGIRGLFTNERLPYDDGYLPKGLHRYDLRYSDDGDFFAEMASHIVVNHAGTFVTKEEITQLSVLLEKDSVNFLDKDMNPWELVNSHEEDWK